jgi:hypothetical protein
MHREFVADRSPAYARLIDLLRPRVESDLAGGLRGAWEGRSFGFWPERPLMLLTSLRDDALREGQAHPLWPAIGPSLERDLGAITDDAVAASIAPGREHFWHSLATRHVQTNDPSRAVSWMWPAAIAAEGAPEREIELFDFGASAGLNLVADRLPWVWSTVAGARLEPSAVPAVASRRGFDLRPPDLRVPEDARWLEALIWPGQDERLERFRAGLAAYRELAAEAGGSLVERASVDDAAAALAPRRAGEARGIAYQSIMHDYLPVDVRERYEASLREWVAASDHGAALWIEFEIAEGGSDGETAVAITVHAREGDGVATEVLGRCGPHPRVVTVDEAAVERFRARTR